MPSPLLRRVNYVTRESHNNEMEDVLTSYGLRGSEKLKNKEGHKDTSLRNLEDEEIKQLRNERTSLKQQIERLQQRLLFTEEERFRSIDSSTSSPHSIETLLHDLSQTSLINEAKAKRGLFILQRANEYVSHHKSQETHSRHDDVMEENDRLTMEVWELREKLARSTKVLEESVAERQQLKTSLSEMRNHMTQREREEKVKEEGRREAREIEERNRRGEEEKKHLDMQLYQSQLKKLDLQLRSYGGKMRQMMEVVEGLQSTISQSEDEVHRLTAECTRFEGKLREREEEVERLRDTLRREGEKREKNQLEEEKRDLQLSLSRMKEETNDRSREWSRHLAEKDETIQFHLRRQEEETIRWQLKLELMQSEKMSLEEREREWRDLFHRSREERDEIEQEMEEEKKKHEEDLLIVRKREEEKEEKWREEKERSEERERTLRDELYRLKEEERKKEREREEVVRQLEREKNEWTVSQQDIVSRFEFRLEQLEREKRELEEKMIERVRQSEKERGDKDELRDFIQRWEEISRNLLERREEVERRERQEREEEEKKERQERGEMKKIYEENLSHLRQVVDGLRRELCTAEEMMREERDRCKDATSQREEMSGELEAVKRICNETREELERTIREKEVITVERNELRRNFDEILEKLHASEEKRMDILRLEDLETEEKRNLTEKYEVLQAEYNSLSHRHQQMEEEAGKSSEKFHEEKKRLEEMVRDSEKEMEIICCRHRRQEEEAQVRTKQMRGEIQSLLDQCREGEEEVERLRREEEKREKMREQMDREITEIREKFQAELQERDERYRTEMDETREEKEMQLSELRETCDLLTLERNDLSFQLESANANARSDHHERLSADCDRHIELIQRQHDIDIMSLKASQAETTLGHNRDMCRLQDEKREWEQKCLSLEEKWKNGEELSVVETPSPSASDEEKIKTLEARLVKERKSKVQLEAAMNKLQMEMIEFKGRMVGLLSLIEQRETKDKRNL
ncbi:hypothetical protein PROFUN_07127 [Planoprotostelium fungivorum]|uniref:Trichohyalin-like n=1 Tax=Planoprotostelium fungivorum TaxID=1890364 RepID=A0A2P6NMJ2_9EUKA|nr:hypothetical protein PROFUN_07127 [Planoprotostelium fungivorum]